MCPGPGDGSRRREGSVDLDEVRVVESDGESPGDDRPGPW